jgi:uncharacterized pyridoxamine 5'-phosphate oxidase family protein
MWPKYSSSKISHPLWKNIKKTKVVDSAEAYYIVFPTKRLRTTIGNVEFVSSLSIIDLILEIISTEFKNLFKEPDNVIYVV